MPPRSTHDYPAGKPLPILLSEVAFGVFALFWVFGSLSWWRIAIFGIVLIALLLVRGELLYRYERLGRAVRRPTQKIIFRNGMPVPLRVMRYAVFVPMIAVFAFGMAPLATARIGIIASILTLLVMALAYVGLQACYVKVGKAEEIDIQVVKE